MLGGLWSRGAVARATALSLPAHFALLSGAVVVLFGLVLGSIVHRVVQDRAETDVRRCAALVTRVGIQSRLVPTDLVGGAAPIDDGRRAALAAVLDGDLARERVAAARVVDQAGREVWSSGAAEADALLVSVPLRALPDNGSFAEDPAAPIVGHVVVAMAAEPVAASIAQGTGPLYRFIGLGLVALWAMSVGLVVSTSQRLRREAAAHHHQARHDALTGLPNRIAFREHLTDALADGPVAVVLVDLDRFKEINDTLGHHHGDELLVHVGKRLGGSQVEGGPITVARLGGDEFAVLLPGVSRAGTAVEVVTCLLEVLHMPIEVDGLALEVGGSAGIALAPAHGVSSDELLQRADVAMYQAKSDRSAVEVYDPDRDTDSTQRLAVAHEIRQAIERKDMVVHYRPTLDLQSMQVVGVETVVHWHHPRLGLIAAEEFMPIVETTALVGQLADYVIGEALRQCREWRRRGVDLRITVNLAASSVLDSALTSDVVHALDRHGLPADVLVLQLREATLLANPARAAEVLGRLRALGVGIAVEGVGAGPASLVHVVDLPVQRLMIDRTLVAGMADGGTAAVIVGFAIELARTLGLTVIADGIEDLAVLDLLIELGCDEAQGELVAHPGPAAEIEAVARSFEAIPTPRAAYVGAPVEGTGPAAPVSVEVAT